MICMWSSWCHCHPIIFCIIKIQIGLTFLVAAYPGCPGKEVIKWVSVCLCADQVIRMDARRNDPTVNSEDLAREKLALQMKAEKLKQDNTKKRDVSYTRSWHRIRASGRGIWNQPVFIPLRITCYHTYCQLKTDARLAASLSTLSVHLSFTPSLKSKYFANPSHLRSHLVMAALCSRCGHYIFVLFLRSSFFLFFLA